VSDVYFDVKDLVVSHAERVSSSGNIQELPFLECFNATVGIWASIVQGEDGN
jgi:hypothetical protein